MKEPEQKSESLSSTQSAAVEQYRAQQKLAWQLKRQKEKNLLGRKFLQASADGAATGNALFLEVFGEVIRSLRIEKKMTLHDVAEKTGVSLSYLSEIERAKKQPSSEVMELISLSLGVKLSDILRFVATALDLEETDRKGFLKSGMFCK